MKKLLFLIALCLISCNQNKPKNELVVSDTIAVEENGKVSTTKSKIKPFKETLTYEEAMKTSSIKELKEFIKENPYHENSDDLNVRLIDLEVEQIINK